MQFNIALLWLQHQGIYHYTKISNFPEINPSYLKYKQQSAAFSVKKSQMLQHSKHRLIYQSLVNVFGGSWKIRHGFQKVQTDLLQNSSRELLWTGFALILNCLHSCARTARYVTGAKIQNRLLSERSHSSLAAVNAGWQNPHRCL